MSSSKKKRHATFAEMVEAVASAPPPPKQTLWHRVDELLEPDRAQALIAAGAPWLVELCWGAAPPPADASPDLHDVLSKTVGEREVRRYRKKHSVPTVFVAEEWQDEERQGSLVLFVEQGPAPRVDPGPMPLDDLSGD